MPLLVYPRQGIGAARLGDSPRAVREAVGTRVESTSAYERFGVRFPARDLFHGGALAVHYDRDERAEWIAATDPLPLRYQGLDLFQAGADTVLAHLARFGPVEEDAEEPGRAFRVPTLGLSLWRQEDPAVLKRALAEAHGEGERRSLRGDLARAAFFQQVAVYADE